MAQSCIRTATLKSFQHTFPELLPVRVDKYPLLYVVATIVTYYQLILHVFTQVINYRHLFTWRSPTRARNVLFFHYNLCVQVYPQILNYLSPIRLRNTLSIHVPTLERIPIKTPLLPVPSHPITPHTLCTVKNTLLQEAQQQMHVTDSTLYTPPPRIPLWTFIRRVSPLHSFVGLRTKNTHIECCQMSTGHCKTQFGGNMAEARKQNIVG